MKLNAIENHCGGITTLWSPLRPSPDKSSSRNVAAGRKLVSDKAVFWELERSYLG